MLDACFGNKSVNIAQRRYLGSKTRLLPFIEGILESEKVEFTSFADIFAGTGVVASHFHTKADVILNDILDSNHLSYQAFFGKQKIRKNLMLERLNFYNEIDPRKVTPNYFSRNFANTYYDLDNSKLIGFIREDIETLFSQKEINDRERSYLVTSLIYAMDRIANTVGHYDAYRKIEIPKKKLGLKPLQVINSDFNARIYKEDANSLVEKISTDVVYIDPPYNSRQYSDAYHLLENVASWQKQKVHGVAKKIDRAHLKSHYSLKSASAAFSELINNINAKYILVSYNDMGTSGNQRSQSRISDHELISALERRGKVSVYEKAHNQFTTGKSGRDDLKERIFFCRIEDKKKNNPSVFFSEKNAHQPEFVKSPLNYTGGKHKLLPQITPYFPKEINSFYDVFCGGANVGVNSEAKEIICIDKNQRVVNLLKLIQESNYDELNQNLTNIIRRYGLSQSYIHGYEVYACESTSGLGRYNKNAYLKLREDFNKNGAEDYLRLLTLILYGFNNQIRFNSKGHYNLPVGKRDYNGSSRKNLANFNRVTNQKKVVFRQGDFRDLNNINLGESDFVYLDPPYLLGLASYNEAGGWTEKDEFDLYETLGNLNERGVRFALSNVIEHKGHHNEILAQFAKKNHFQINDMSFNYHNSNYQSKAKDNQTREVLVTNYKS
jgi:adenine-specific DNA-methyltransferase